MKERVKMNEGESKDGWEESKDEWRESIDEWRRG